MLKSLFLQLIHQNTQEEFSASHIKLLQKYFKNSIIKKVDNHYVLNKKYAVGEVLGYTKDCVQVEVPYFKHPLSLSLSMREKLSIGDFVLVQRIFHPRSKIDAKLYEVLEKSTASVFVYKQNNKIYSLKDHVLMSDTKIQGLENKMVALVENSTVKKVIANIDKDKDDEAISMNIFDESYRMQQKKFEIPTCNFELGNRVDLRDLDFCTIDPASAKDHDDALYFDTKESVLYVAIADVSSFVPLGSDLDISALQNAFSIYLPHKVYPMLPPKLSEDLCSLKQDVPRYAYVAKLTLDTHNLEVTKSEFFEALIEVKKQYSYGKVQRVLEGKKDKTTKYDMAILDNICELYTLTKKFREKRMLRGYDFRTQEYSLKLDKDQKLQSIQHDNSNQAHQLVEECMLLANVAASKQLQNYGIYRVHEEPSLQKITTLLDDAALLGIKSKHQKDIHSTITKLQRQAHAIGVAKEVDELIIKSQQQARYQSIKSGHFGLGFDSYSHFTSPIRRYADLVLHRVLKTQKVPKDIETICEKISTKERKINELVWDFEDRKYARWAKENIGKTLEAMIVNTQNPIAQVTQKILGMRVAVQNYQGEKLFQKVIVKIEKVDVISKSIVASIQ